MKIDFDRPILGGIDGKTQIATPPEHVQNIGPKVTLKGASYLALNLFVNSEDGIAKNKSFELWQKIKAGGIVELEAEECALLKTKIGTFWFPDVVGHSWKIIEGKDG